MECSTDEFLQICRVCMTDNASYVVLNNQEDSFIEVTGIHTYQEALKDILPLSICASCHDEFTKCLKFRETARKTNAALRKLKTLGKLTIDNTIKLSGLLRDDFESTEVSYRNQNVKKIAYDSSKNVMLENYEDEFIINLNEDQECFEEIQSHDGKESNKDIIVTSEPINERVSDNERISDITTDDEKPIKKKCTSKTKTKAARKQSVDKRKKNNLTRKSRRKKRTNADPNSLSSVLFSNVLKSFTYYPLNAEEQRKMFAKRRLDESFLRSTHKCMLCNRGFRIKETFDRHVQLKHVEICDADLNIIPVDASFGGATHDSFIWNQHPIKAHLEELIRNGEEVYLLGDSGYAQRESMMTPIVDAVEGSPEEHYTKLHCTARNIVERTIGVLKNRWRCLLKPRVLHYHPDVAAKIIISCCVLHNMCNRYFRPEDDIAVEEDVDMGNNVADHNVPRDRNIALQRGLDTRSRLVQRLWLARN